METIEEVRKFFEGDRYATSVTGAVIEEFTSTSAKCSLVLNDGHRNAIGAVMGGAIYTLCDFAFAVATNNVKPCCVTAVSNISFLNPVKGSIIYAEARPVKDGRKLCTYEVTVTDDCGVKVAYATMTGAKNG